MTAGGKGAGPTQQVTDYRMAVHVGVSTPVDAITGVYVDDKTVWEGEVDTNQDVYVSQPNLFGGPKQGGGAVGILRMLLGGPTQTLDDETAEHFGRTSSTIPFFRDIASVLFTDASGLGFLWSTNNPVIAQKVSIRGQRTPKTPLDQSVARIPSLSDTGFAAAIGASAADAAQHLANSINTSSLLFTAAASGDTTVITTKRSDNSYIGTVDCLNPGTSDNNFDIGGFTGSGPYSATITFRRLPATGNTLTVGGEVFTFTTSGGGDINPAHLIYEVLTDQDFGSGMLDEEIDADSFNYAASVLFGESMGMSLAWFDQAVVEDFVNEILKHINGVCQLSPVTGLMTLKLLRADYDIDSLPVYDPDNAQMTDFQRSGWGETINEIVVTWTNPATNKPETVTVQDLGNYQIQGGIVSDSRDFHGFRNSAVAMRAGERELRAVSGPLLTMEMTTDRSSWNRSAGDPLIVNWPENSVFGAVMRIGRINYGKTDDSKITVSLVRDVFSLDRRIVQPTTPTSWVNPATPPAPLTNYQVSTLPAYFASSGILQSAPVALTYPEVLGMVFAYSSNRDVTGFDLATDLVLSTGDTAFVDTGAKTLTELASLTINLAAEAVSTFPVTMVTHKDRGPQVGGFVFIGAGDAVQEICLVDSTDDVNWTIKRGVLDTIPRAWSIGTPVWFVNGGARIVEDRNLRAAGETVEYKLLTRTSQGILALGDAPEIDTVLTGRPHLPLRPANVKVNGVGFGSVALGGNATIAVTWATRNRTLEDGQVVPWTDGPIAPEYAQATVVTVRNPSNAVVYQQTGLWTENELDLPASYFARWPSVTIQVSSTREGLDSLQGYALQVTGLANNGSASLPPAPPAVTDPPSPVAAPLTANWTVSPVSVPATSGESVPVLHIGGASTDNSAATALAIRYKKHTDSAWTDHPLIPLQGFSGANLIGLTPLTSYDVQLAYQVPFGDTGFLLSLWQSFGPVTTGALVSSDTTAVGGTSATTLLSNVASTLAGIAALTATYGSTTAAATSAINAANSATAAATSASNAASSSTAALASQTAAATSATNASTSATTASNQAAAAATQATNALNQAIAAANSATTAASSATAAAGSATAAAGSATTATTQATAAGTSATSATASANTATSQATNAATSATAAANSATAAATSSTSSSLSASAASSSSTAASLAATDAAYLDAFAAYNFLNTNNGFTVTSGTLTVGAAASTFALTGAAAHIDKTGVSFLGSRYTRVLIDIQRTVARVGGAWQNRLYWSTSGHGVGNVGFYTAPLNDVDLTLNQRTTFAYDFVTPTAGGTDWTASTVTGLQLALDTTSGGSFKVYSIRVVGPDTTAPATAAAAAATSATNAATSATAAGTSATAASNSATTASTQAANASTSATNASTSATAAAGSATNAATSASAASTSATTASTQAANASTSATNASNSATSAAGSATSAASSASAASTSATTASTQASNASTSATSASSSATSAANSAGAASTSATAANTSATNASTSASNASTSATNASTSATNAANSATGASTSASAASSSATTASTQAANASTSAGASSTSATAAANSATAAAGSATSASTSAGSASTSAGQASTSATGAANSASAASTSATNAASSASSASTSASSASSSSGAAASSATNAATSATSATSSANSAASSATNASTSAASAASSATLAASIGFDALNKNPVFSTYTTTPGVPDNWADWVNGTAGTRVTGQDSPNAYRLPGGAGVQAGIVQLGGGSNPMLPMRTGWYVLEADVTLVSGALTGAGIVFNGYTTTAYSVSAGSANLVFATDKDISDTVIGVGTTGQTYRFRKLVQLADTAMTCGQLFAQSHNSGLGSIAGANSIDWHRADIRPASQPEIAAARADANATSALASISSNAAAQASVNSAQASTNSTVSATLASQSASISTQSTAVATLQQVYATYGMRVNVNGAFAGYTLYAASGPTNGNGIVFDADNFQIRSSSHPAVVPFNYNAVDGVLDAPNIRLTGSIKIQSSPSGGRTEYADTTIKVYDTSGVLRVQIGQL